MDRRVLRFLRRRRVDVELKQGILSGLNLADLATDPVGVHELVLDPEGAARLAHGQPALN